MAPPGGRLESCACHSCLLSVIFSLDPFYISCYFTWLLSVIHMLRTWLIWGNLTFVLRIILFFLKFLPFPGATFCTFIDNPALFERIKETNPDFVIVILGGNDLKANIELSHIYDRCKSFYTTLRSYLPNSWIIASQIENRFYHPQNRFGSPPIRRLWFFT